MELKSLRIDFLLYDPSENFMHSIIQRQNSFNILLKSISRKLFPGVKFIKKENDLLHNIKYCSVFC